MAPTASELSKFRWWTASLGVFPVKKQFYLIVSPNFNSETAESFGKVELNLASTPSLECLRRQYSGKVEPDLECLRRRLLEEPFIRLHVES